MVSTEEDHWRSGTLIHILDVGMQALTGITEWIALLLSSPIQSMPEAPLPTFILRRLPRLHCACEARAAPNHGAYCCILSSMGAAVEMKDTCDLWTYLLALRSVASSKPSSMFSLLAPAIPPTNHHPNIISTLRFVLHLSIRLKFSPQFTCFTSVTHVSCRLAVS